MGLDVFLYNCTIKKCPHCNQDYEERVEVYTNHITSNLTQMAREAEIYHALWHPERIGDGVSVTAGQLIPYLKKGIKKMEGNEGYFRHFNHASGWGSYKDLYRFTAEYLLACEQYPSSIVRISS